MESSGYYGTVAGLTLVKAREENLPAIMQILKNNALWLREKGVDQWRHLLTDEEDIQIRENILAGETYILLDEEKAAATFTLSLLQNDWDRELWEDAPERTLYLHRLAVCPDYKGKRIGEAALSWIRSQLTADGQAAMLRLDCVAGNDRLNSFYQEVGCTFEGKTPSGFSKYSIGPL